MSRQSKLPRARYHRRSLLAGIAAAPFIAVVSARSAQASKRWIKLFAGKSGNNRFEYVLKNGVFWVQFHNVTDGGKPVTGAHPCKLRFASGNPMDATAWLDGTGNGQTGEYDDKKRGKVIGVEVCV